MSRRTVIIVAWLITLTCVGSVVIAHDADAARRALRARGANVNEEDRAAAIVHFSSQELSVRDIQHLKTLSPAVIGLHGEDYSDGDAMLLAELSSLQRITLMGTKATAEAVAALHQRLPQVAVTWTNGPFLGLGLGNDLLVASAPERLAAGKAGIRTGDKLTHLDGDELMSVQDVFKRISRSSPGELLHVTLQRDGEVVNVTVEVGRITSSR